MQESHATRVLFLHGLVLFDSLNVQKHATKSDALGHCLFPRLVQAPSNKNTHQLMMDLFRLPK